MFSPEYATLMRAQRHLLVCACVPGLTRPMSALCWRSSSWKRGTSFLSGGGNNENNHERRLDEKLKLYPVAREQVGSNVLPASWLQDHDAALFIPVWIKKSREFQAVMDFCWCSRSSGTSKKSGGTFLLCDCVCLPQVCLIFELGSGSVAEDELLWICMQGHTRLDTDVLTHHLLRT